MCVCVCHDLMPSNACVLCTTMYAFARAPKKANSCDSDNNRLASVYTHECMHGFMCTFSPIPSKDVTSQHANRVAGRERERENSSNLRRNEANGPHGMPE